VALTLKAAAGPPAVAQVEERLDGGKPAASCSYDGRRPPVCRATAAVTGAPPITHPAGHLEQMSPPRSTVAIFLDGPPPRDAPERATGRAGEEIRLGKREIYVHYGDGMARSRLKVPAAKAGTVRNINTITRLAEMASELGG